MAKRPTLTKQVERVRRELRRSEPQSFVNVYNWLKLRGHVKTREQAVALVLGGRLVDVSGKPLGILGTDDDPYAAGYIDSKVAEGMTVKESA